MASVRADSQGRICRLPLKSQRWCARVIVNSAVASRATLRHITVTFYARDIRFASVPVGAMAFDTALHPRIQGDLAVKIRRIKVEPSVGMGVGQSRI